MLIFSIGMSLIIGMVFGFFISTIGDINEKYDAYQEGYMDGYREGQKE